MVSLLVSFIVVRFFSHKTMSFYEIVLPVMTMGEMGLLSLFAYYEEPIFHTFLITPMTLPTTSNASLITG